MKKKRLGELLVEAGLISERAVHDALGQQLEWGTPLGRTLVQMGLLTEQQLIPVLAAQLDLPAVDLATVSISPAAIALVDEAFCQKYGCLPFAHWPQEGVLDVASADTPSRKLLDQLASTGCTIRPFLGGLHAIRDAIERAYRAPAPVLDELDVWQQALTLGVDAEDPQSSSSMLARLEAQELVLQRLIGHLRSTFDQLARTQRLDLPTDHPLLPRAEPAASPPEDAPIAPPPVAYATAAVASLLRPPLAEPEAREEPEGPLREDPSPSPTQEPVLAPPTFHSGFARPAAPPLGASFASPGPPPRSTPATVVAAEAVVPVAEPSLSATLPNESPEPPIGHVDDRGFLTERRRGGLPSSDPRTERAVVAASGGTPASAPLPARAGAIRPVAREPLDAAEPTLPLLELPSTARCAVAIDLGTTRSSVATVIDGRVSMLRLPGGEWDIPSVVGFRADNSVVVGSTARRMLSSDVENAIASPKRLLGRRIDEPALAPYLARLGMKATAGPRGDIMLHSHGRQLTITEACSHVLKLLRLVAEHNLGRPVREVILTIPASSGERQVRALSDAAALASLRVLEFIQEPVAAAMACIFDEACQGRVAVYDFGGGTFDFSIVEVGADGMEVIATAGDSWLGGDDFDAALAGAAANACWQQHRVELRHQADHWQRLLVASEITKRVLSEHNATVLRLRGVLRDASGQADFEFPVTRAAFAKMTKGIVARSLETCKDALVQAKIHPRDLSAIYLSGGSSYIPAVREGVAAFFGQEPRAVVPPERLVVLGAAVHGAMMAAADA